MNCTRTPSVCHRSVLEAGASTSGVVAQGWDSDLGISTWIQLCSFAKEQSSWGLDTTNRYSGGEDQRESQLVCISGEQSTGEAGTCAE